MCVFTHKCVKAGCAGSATLANSKSSTRVYMIVWWLLPVCTSHLLPPFPSPPFCSHPSLRLPSLSLPSPSLPALAVHDPQWYAVFTSQFIPEHTQLVQEMLTVAAYTKVRGGWSGVRGRRLVWVLCDGEERERELQLFHLYHALQSSSQHTSHNTLTQHPWLLHCTLPSPSLESKEIARAGGYQFTMTHMPNTLHLVAEIYVPVSFQWLCGMEAVLINFHLFFMSCVEQFHTHSAE